MSKVIKYMPELEGEEQLHIARLMKPMNEEQAAHFAHVYRQRRRDPNLILFSALAGFLGFGGIHRFLLGQIGMGILYLFTAGLCLIGTIVDLFNYRKLTLTYNLRQADDIASLIRGVFPPDDGGQPHLLT